MLHTEEAPQGTRLVVDTLSCLIAKEADPSRIMAQVHMAAAALGMHTLPAHLGPHTLTPTNSMLLSALQSACTVAWSQLGHVPHSMRLWEC